MSEIESERTSQEGEAPDEESETLEESEDETTTGVASRAASARASGAAKAAARTMVGTVVHFYTDINVGVIELSNDLRQGDKIRFEGFTTNFTQEVSSMQKEGQEIAEAHAGDSIGIRVANRVREGDKVFKV